MYEKACQFLPVGFFVYIYFKINIMSDSENRAVPGADNHAPTRRKEKVVIENMFDTVTKQYADKERQDLRLEAMKIAASQMQYNSAQSGQLQSAAEEIYQWIIKPE